MTDTLALAGLLRGTDDDALVAGLTLRGIAPAGIRDFFDLADALLDAESIQGCLQLLDRHLLSALWTLGAAADAATDADASGTGTETGTGTGTGTGTSVTDARTLERVHAMLLVDDTGTPLRAVMEQLRKWPSLGLPEPSGFSSPLPAPEAELDNDPAVRGTVDHLAAEHAFSATTAIAELLFELEHNPARLLAKGDLGIPETRRLAEIMAVDEAEATTLIDAAERAGLVERERSQLHATSGHQVWLAGSASARWRELVAGWARALPATILEQLTEHTEVRSVAVLRDWLNWLYPGGGQPLSDQLDARLAESLQLGITANGALSSAGAAMLRGDHEGAAELLSSQLPAPVREIYLQHDLSVVAPGPLDADIDLRLRGMAEVDGRALASRYRMSDTSIDGAITGGETADSILEFLGSVSKTPIPQPILYLVQQTAERHGRLRVGAIPGDGSAAAGTAAAGGAAADARNDIAVTFIRTEDSALLGAVMVDSRLAVLGLSARSVNEVVSRRDRDQVYWALIAARYPAAAVDGSGQVITLRREEPTKVVAPVPDKLEALVAKLRLADEGASDDTGKAWLARQLEMAIRTKSTVTVSVRMPNGTVVDHQLEPASVSGGRLRAKDPVSEIERTLPLSSIAAVTTA